MLMLKCVGGGILLAVCLGYSNQNARQARRMAERLDAWIGLLTYVRGQISCFGRPLADILSTAEPRLLAALDMDTCHLRPLRDYCREDATLLSGWGGEHLLALAEALGTVWWQEQVARLDYYLAEMDQARQSYKAKLSERVRLRGAMLLCGALGMILLVW
jgi:hypothetical protein